MVRHGRSRNGEAIEDLILLPCVPCFPCIPWSQLEVTRTTEYTENTEIKKETERHRQIVFMLLEVKDLHAGIDGKEILTGLNLQVNTGEVHAIMGPNGSGKST